MDKSAAILQFIQRNGPIVPAQVNKHIGVDVMFASAMLAELSSKNKLKISKLKVGGSPLYFIPGQESQLSRFAHKLGEKDKRTHDLLESHKVLDEAQLDPLVRVSLRQIPDFAVPLLINHEGQERLFWKYFTITDEEAEKIIKEKLGITQKKAEVEIEQPKVEDVGPALSEDIREQIKEELRRELEAERKKQEETRPPEPSAPPEKPKTEPKKPDVEPKKPEVKAKKEKAPDPSQKKLVEEELEEPEDEFYDQIKNYFAKHDITILDASVVRKNSDLDLTILMPTAMGDVKYYCKAKSKKKVNDGDLSSAYVQAQMKKMPVLFITTGEVTKKGLDLAQKEFTTMIIKQL